MFGVCVICGNGFGHHQTTSYLMIKVDDRMWSVRSQVEHENREELCLGVTLVDWYS